MPIQAGAPLPEGFEDLVTLWQRSLAAHGDRPFLGVRRGERWQWLTYREIGRRIEICAASLRGLGIGIGDRVAIIASNRIEWVIGCHAAYSIGAVWVPMYELQHERDWLHALSDSGSRVVFVAHRLIAERVQSMRAGLPALEHVIVLDGDDADGFAALQQKYQGTPLPAATPAPDHLAEILYTSGTMGAPKGVRLSHRNLATNVRACLVGIPMERGDRTLAFLPWAHVFGGSIELHGAATVGASLAICEQLDKLVDYLPEVAPTVLVTAPRFWNRVYERVVGHVAGQARWLRKLFARGIRAARRRVRGETLDWRDRLFRWVTDQLLFGKVRRRLGGRLRFAVSGSAALSPELCELVEALGISVYEGYGLTEAGGVVTGNRPAQQRRGSVGRPIPGVRVAIDPTVPEADGASGEIIVYGPGVTEGYHNLANETARLFTEDRGLRTGDFGRFDEDGYLYITGRLKELHKLTNGNYVAPSPLEEELQLSPFIAQAMVYGADRPHNVALVVPAIDRVLEWARKHGHPPDVPKLLASPELRALVEREIERLSTSWKSYEKVRDFAFVSEAFSTENDLLTPSLKIKRRNVVKRFGDELDRLYAQPQDP